MARTYKVNDEPYSEERERCERIFGKESCIQVYNSRPEAIVKAYVRKGEEGQYKDLLSSMAADRMGYKLVPEEELRKIAKTEHHEGICLLVKKREKLNLSTWLECVNDSKGILFLDGVDNPHNIGGILRTALYFGVTAVVINSPTSFTLSGSLARTSEGAVEYLNILQDFKLENLLKELKSRGYKFVISTTQDEEKVPSLEEVPEKWVLFVGSEGRGISKESKKSADLAVHIEAGSKLESLNVSVATGILLYEFTKVN